MGTKRCGESMVYLYVDPSESRLDPCHPSCWQLQKVTLSRQALGDYLESTVVPKVITFQKGETRTPNDTGVGGVSAETCQACCLAEQSQEHQYQSSV